MDGAISLLKHVVDANSSLFTKSNIKYLIFIFKYLFSTFLYRNKIECL